jgi:hypothetical protein
VTPLAAEVLVAGDAAGALALLGAPLSLYGGFDAHTGIITDATHPQRGLCLTGRVLAMRAARGSSSSASTLVEAARRGTAPAAILLARIDPILVIGACVAQDLYGSAIPVLLVAPDRWHCLRDGLSVHITDTDGLLLGEADDIVLG